jgi:hypothetical protein
MACERICLHYDKTDLINAENNEGYYNKVQFWASHTIKAALLQLLY